MRAQVTTNSLMGQVALVMGASSGLGRASALALANAGVDVGMIGRSETELVQVAEAIRAIGRRALTMSLDLADESQVTTAIIQFLGLFRRIDILVNAAATVVGPRAGETLGELSLAIHHGMRTRDLASVTHAYPPYNDAVWNAAVRDVRTSFSSGITGRAIGPMRVVRRIWVRWRQARCCYVQSTY